MEVFYSRWAGETEPQDELDSDQNRFALALRRVGIAYKTWDFTQQEREHWQRKLHVVAQLQTEFEAEGNDFLYQRRFIEAQSHQEFIDAGRVRRWLYRILF